LTSSNNGNCFAVSDTVIIAVKQLASVNAGPNKHICSNTPTVAITSTISGVTNTGIWTTNGTGAFIPGSAFTNNTYFITVSDITAGLLSYTLSSTNNGPCPVVTDTMFVFITPLATVNAGPNQFICSTTNSISLNGSVSSSSNTGTWASGGGGSYSPSNTILNPFYLLTPSDASNGSVTFTLSSSNNFPCPVVRDTVQIKIKKPAVVNAGPDQSICSTSISATLNGSVSGGSFTGIWSAMGSGNFLPNNSALNGIYMVTSADINSGFVNLILTSTNNQVCPAVSDTSKLTIIKDVTINLLNDTTICAYQNPLKISANVSGGSGQYAWTSSGTGTFVSVSGFNTVNYFMSAADIANGSVNLTISSINNGPCGAKSGMVNVTINPAPTANFSASTYTANIPNDPIKFTNLSTNANSYYWSFGDGGFTSQVNPLYNYNAVGFYTVSLIAINQFNCRDTIEQDILVISDIQFPNVFTPNANGSNGGSYNFSDLSNDVFFPYTSGVVEYKLLIFNRWGELIFESNDINIGWDGYFRGKLCQQDAYVWKANVKFFDDRIYKKTGSVTLLR
ncbi:MAG: gliding motility-associated C-terminal domain-containing protein, partial [Bacteroidetes bacterium]|nr:gliding motility-associated C-terminal domain-containing protein [Bacteroidota bacterium]